MPKNESNSGLANQLAGLLPYLRRHARAMTGSQPAGDRIAYQTLEAILADPAAIAAASTPRVGLFAAFYQTWQHTAPAPENGEEGRAGRAQTYLRGLMPDTRQALLLRSIEDFSIQQIAEIMTISVPEVETLITTARQDMQDAISGRILVIEDEAMIAMDLQDIVTAMGHATIGAATTHAQAVQLAAEEEPDLILSDIQLADGSSGIAAVDEILQAAADTPVIFVTAFPELLLTGERREPAFVITKPYGEEQIQSAVSQAMFFRSSDGIKL